MKKEPKRTKMEHKRECACTCQSVRNSPLTQRCAHSGEERSDCDSSAGVLLWSLAAQKGTLRISICTQIIIIFSLVTRRRVTFTGKSCWNSAGIANYAQAATESNSPSEFPMRETQNTMMYATMRTHSYCLGCKYSLQMYLRSSSSSSAAGCRFNSVVLETCAGDKHSSQSKFPVTPDILSKRLRVSSTPAVYLQRVWVDVPIKTQHWRSDEKAPRAHTSSVWRWFYLCLSTAPWNRLL